MHGMNNMKVTHTHTNMKTTMKVYLQLNAEITKNMFHVSRKECRANSSCKDKKKKFFESEENFKYLGPPLRNQNCVY